MACTAVFSGLISAYELASSEKAPGMIHKGQGQAWWAKPPRPPPIQRRRSAQGAYPAAAGPPSGLMSCHELGEFAALGGEHSDDAACPPLRSTVCTRVFPAHGSRSLIWGPTSAIRRASHDFAR